MAKIHLIMGPVSGSTGSGSGSIPEAISGNPFLSGLNPCEDIAHSVSLWAEGRRYSQLTFVVSPLDGYIYICISPEPHIATLDNMPGAGPSWESYWQKLGRTVSERVSRAIEGNTALSDTNLVVDADAFTAHTNAPAPHSGHLSLIDGRVPVTNIEPYDVVGGRVVRAYPTQLRWSFTTSNQIRLWSESSNRWELVRLVSNPTITLQDLDIGGTSITYGRCYDIFLRFVSTTEASLQVARWQPGTSPRYWPWATGTLWKVGDRVSYSGNYYLCVQEHTSGVFADDLASGKWLQVGPDGLGSKDGVPTLGGSGVWAEYRHIGIVYPVDDGEGAPTFVDSLSQRLIANRYNPTISRLTVSVNAYGATFNNTSPQLWTNWNSAEMSCVVAAPQAGLIASKTHCGNNSSGTTYAVIYQDNSTISTVTSVAAGDGYKPSNAYPPIGAWYANPGYHYFDLRRYVNTGTSTHYVGSLTMSLLQ